MRADRLPEVDLSCLKVWTVGAEMISAESCRILQEQLAPMGLAPHLLMPGYGLTETTLVAMRTSQYRTGLPTLVNSAASSPLGT